MALPLQELVLVFEIIIFIILICYLLTFGEMDFLRAGQQGCKGGNLHTEMGLGADWVHFWVRVKNYRNRNKEGTHKAHLRSRPQTLMSYKSPKL